MIPRRRHSPMRRNTASICLADMRRSNDRRQPTCDLAHQFPNEHILAHRGGSRQSASERKPTRNERGKMDPFDGSWIQHILVNYGYAAIFIIVMLESAGVPLPGETILVSAAAFAGNKHSLDIRYVIAAAAGGAIFGDNIGFWVGREFGTSLLSRWGYLIGFGERKRKLGQYLFARHGGKIVFFGRFHCFAARLCGTAGWRKRI